MSVQVTCQGCRRIYQLKDALLGKRFKCQACDTIVRIEPDQPQTAFPDLDKSPRESNRPRRRRRPDSDKAGDSAASPRRRKQTTKRQPRSTAPSMEPATNDDAIEAGAAEFFSDMYVADDSELSGDDDFGNDPCGGGMFDDGLELHDDGSAAALPQPTKKRKKKKKRTTELLDDGLGKSAPSRLPPLTFNPNRLNIAAVVAGGALLFFGLQELWLGSRSSSEPQAITLAELESDGPGNEIYFTISGVLPAADEYVYEEDQYGKLSRAWIPCSSVPLNGNAKLLLYDTSVRREEDVVTLMMLGTHTGMIINDISGLGRDERKLLLESDVDPDDMYIFEVGREPSGFIKYSLMIGGGLFFIAGGLALIFLFHE